MTSVSEPAGLAAECERVRRHFVRKRATTVAVPVLVVAYLVYAFFAFDVPSLADRARLDNVGVLLGDMWSHKTHVTRDNRSGSVTVAIEGETKGTYTADRLPEWVTVSGDVTSVDLGGGSGVVIEGDTTRFTLDGYGTVVVVLDGRRVSVSTPDGVVPDWINASDTRVSLTTDAGRLAVTRNQTVVYRYQPGWELFFFDLESPFHGQGPLELLQVATTGDRIDADRPNVLKMASDFWNNRMWRHGDVAWAMFETVLMAVLGTVGAALVALPTAFLAASNFAPARTVRFAVRRIFDFLRGVDGLIWTIILSRAFGPGPLTGSLAILITDTGTLGKMFSEALENVDSRQIEGVTSTGANNVQTIRFGVIPQVVPVLLSHVLYYLESNTRSATVIGALVGGGIGLLLTQAIATQKDWEEVTYYIVLVILMVMAMDSLSGWLRTRLIGSRG